MPPVPEIVLVTVSDVVWLNCSVPSAAMLPVMLPPFSMTAVSPGAIVPPPQADEYVVVAAAACAGVGQGTATPAMKRASSQSLPSASTTTVSPSRAGITSGTSAMPSARRCLTSPWTKRACSTEAPA